MIRTENFSACLFCVLFFFANFFSTNKDFIEAKQVITNWKILEILL